MHKPLKKEVSGYMTEEPRFDRNVENSKRRHALPPLADFVGDSKFFEKILDVRKFKDFVFLPKSSLRGR